MGGSRRREGARGLKNDHGRQTSFSSISNQPRVLLGKSEAAQKAIEKCLQSLSTVESSRRQRGLS